jgi:uncharacterized protein (DUF362 family)
MVPAKVVVVRGRGVRPRPGVADEAVLIRMFERGLSLLTGRSDPAEAVRSILSPSDRVGIKVNGIAGRELTTPPEVSLPFVRFLARGGIPEKSFVVWDRTGRELKDAGYRLTLDGPGVRVFGTDASGVGYGAEPLVRGGVGSRFSAIQTDLVTASVSFAVLKDHGLAGVTAGMKNYFGAVHNPNKYHDSNCDPYVAEVFDTPPVRGKHRLTVLDALTVQYHRGPSFHPRWAERAETLVFSLDPVAADAVGWRMIEALRKAKGLPTLAEEEREPRYLLTAERLGLGTSRPEGLQVIEDEV